VERVSLVGDCLHGPKNKRRMKLNIFYSLLFLTTLFFSNASAQNTVKKTSGGIYYLQYLPKDYNSNSNNYPIVISLHGIKEKGNTETSVWAVDNLGLPKYVTQGSHYPFILISPQLKTTMGKWTGDYIIQVLNYVKTYLRVDPSRIYLTGMSLGGGGVWTVATAYPNVFASILPICSGYNVTSQAGNIGNADLPTWGFHGDADAIVSESVTINMVNAINNYKPAPYGKVTIFPAMGHSIWDKVYKETNAINWMLSFRKGSTTPVPTPGNVAPTALAGGDKTITLPTNSVTINGSGTDQDGTIASYAWTKKSGGAATLSQTTTKDLKASGLVAGTYTFTLTVKDNTGATDTDDVVVNVKSSTSTTTNVAPVAKAGSDKTITTKSVTIVGSATDVNNNIAKYQWKKLSGGSVTMSGTTTPTLNLSNLAVGNYYFRLVVTDSKGAADYDDMLLVVKAGTVASVEYEIIDLSSSEEELAMIDTNFLTQLQVAD
jgi:hypothetical protein